MELSRQTCQKCGSRKMKNVLIRQSGDNDMTYVFCADCDELVARYVISYGGYYHHNKGFESYINSIRRGGIFISAKNLKKEHEDIQKECDRMDKVIKDYLKEHKMED